MSLMAAAHKRLGEEKYREHYLRGKYTARAHILAWRIQNQLLKNETRPMGKETIAYIDHHDLLNIDLMYRWDVAQAHCQNLQKFEEQLSN